MEFLNNTYNLLVILGATATGKTRLGVKLAERLAQDKHGSCEIISADSRQVFRGMDIGTGKDLAEYGAIPYHLIDIVDPGYEFSVYEFQQRFYAAFTEIIHRERLPILVGGSGLYLDSVVRGYSLTPVQENSALREKRASWSMAELEAHLRSLCPNQHNTTDLDSRERLLRAIEIAEGSQDEPFCATVALKPLVLGVCWNRSLLRQRITDRLQARLAEGLIAEVETLLSNGLSLQRLSAYGLEYRFICRYLAGEIRWDEMFRDLNQAIHKFAKRQETWFRRMERHGVEIHWVEGDRDPLSAALERVESAS